jgi:hypothetical protein
MTNRGSRKCSIGLILLCVIYAGTIDSQASAQTLDPLPARPTTVGPTWLAVSVDSESVDLNRRELEQWIAAYRAWQEWATKWLNKRQSVLHPFPYPFWKDSPALFSYVAPPRVEPAPPLWLESACAPTLRESDLLAEGCELLTVWKDDLSTRKIRAEIVKARAQKDEPTKMVWYEHVHFAGLWIDPQPQRGLGGAYGLAGVHATIDVHDRWQIYALPGILAVSLPNWQGERIVTIGYDWGMAVRLFNFRVPFSSTPARAHLNLVKVWVPEVGQRIDMVGLSLTLKKNR